MIVMPGGAFGQDPTPFVNWAMGHPEVVAMVSFCWFGPREPNDKWVGIGTSTLRAAYVAAGKKLTGIP